ncbi:MAG TPA: hypothetical protein EYM98_09505 [Dehalococcoidia bacterium]|nr:hypothetical protein [Dehalococcoidia bacterium]
MTDRFSNRKTNPIDYGIWNSQNPNGDSIAKRQRSIDNSQDTCNRIRRSQGGKTANVTPVAHRDRLDLEALTNLRPFFFPFG